MSGVVPVVDGLFTDGESPRLLGGRCGSCERPHFPRSSTCPWCSSIDVHDAAFGPSGRLWGWTAVTAAPPGYRGEVPYGFGVVELDEGLRVITRLTEADPAALSFGQPMTLVIEPLHTGDDGDTVVTWAFR